MIKLHKTPQHKAQAVKNWTLFAVLFTLAGIFFWLTILKMSGAAQ